MKGLRDIWVWFGLAWRGRAGQGLPWRRVAWHGMANTTPWETKGKIYVARRASAFHGMAVLGVARLGLANTTHPRNGMGRFTRKGEARRGGARQGTACQGKHHPPGHQREDLQRAAMRGVARLGWAWQGTARPGEARQTPPLGKPRGRFIWRGEARPGRAGRGLARQTPPIPEMGWEDLLGGVGHGKPGLGQARRGKHHPPQRWGGKIYLEGLDTAWRGPAGRGVAWQDAARRGRVRRGKANTTSRSNAGGSFPS